MDDVSNNHLTTAKTLFRICSVSKAFVSLAILKLVSEGKLSLEDPVHQLVPEVWFENRWEKTDPIRVVHLLEHTTGWDDLRLHDYAKNDPTINLLKAFDYAHISRVCRWKPGTRMAYCNSGPAVAAYIVEKITNKNFEEYITKNFFKPIGMKTSTYFQPSESLTTLYHNDGKTPYSYWNLIYRPSGSINASAEDMTNYLLFYLNRGSINGKQIIPSKDIDRMEIPTSTWAAKDGLKVGYGLGNYCTIHDKYIYHGHSGGMPGSLTELAYMSDLGIGYFYSINTSNYLAFQKIGKIIRAYITNNLSKPSPTQINAISPKVTTYTGWYKANSPRNEKLRFLETLIGKAFLHLKDDHLFLTSLGGNHSYVPSSETHFRYAENSDSSPDPISTLALIANDDGHFFQLSEDGSTITMKQIPTWLAISEIAITIFVLLSIVSIIFYAPFWILGGLRKKRRRTQERAIRLWPFSAILSLLVFVIILSYISSDTFHLLGRFTIWSFLLFLITIFFAVSSIAGGISLWRCDKQKTRKSVRIYSGIVISALLIATVYLTYWGMIEICTWVNI